ncbi:MAG: YqgE/AlgH family protein [Bacteroidota bacterium]
MIEPGPGILLIADPFLKDPNFLRTVIFLCEHKEEGSFGFVLNRKYENTLDELLPDLEDMKLPVFFWRAGANGYYSFPSSIPG